jgi:hypothetical protein
VIRKFGRLFESYCVLINNDIWQKQIPNRAFGSKFISFSGHSKIA